MSQPTPINSENPNLPSEGNREPHGAQTLHSQTVGLPWEFWLWQCVPMVYLIIAMPPGEDPKWWFHEPALAWCTQQPWSGLPTALVFTAWFSQGILLAFWMVWGSGFWGRRIFKVLGLSAIAALLPAIWFIRHFRLFSPGLNPWSEVFNPIALSLFYLWAVGCSFLPALLVVGAMYWRGYRMTVVELPPSSLKRWQFSLWGLTVLTFACSVVLAFFSWIYPALVSFVEWLRPAANASSEWDMMICLAVSSALSSLLAGVILIWRKWQVTATVFGFLTVLYLLESVSMSQRLLGERYFRWSGPIFIAVGLALGNMISLVITRYCIGHGRLILTCSRPEPLPSPTASKDVL